MRCKSESGFPFTYGLPVTRTSFNRTFNRTTVTCTIRVYLIEISLWGGNMVSYATLSLSRKIDSLYNWRPLSASSTSTGQSLLPMMRFVPVLGNRCCQTLSGVVICRSLAISTEQAFITDPPQIGDEGLAVRDIRGSERWRPTCVH